MKISEFAAKVFNLIENMPHNLKKVEGNTAPADIIRSYLTSYDIDTECIDLKAWTGTIDIEDSKTILIVCEIDSKGGTNTHDNFVYFGKYMPQFMDKIDTTLYGSKKVDIIFTEKVTSAHTKFLIAKSYIDRYFRRYLIDYSEDLTINKLRKVIPLYLVLAQEYTIDDSKDHLYSAIKDILDDKSINVFQINEIIDNIKNSVNKSLEKLFDNSGCVSLVNSIPDSFLKKLR